MLVTTFAPPQFHRTRYHSPLLSEPLKKEEVIPPQANKIVQLLNNTEYYQVERVVLNKENTVKLVVVHPPHQNSEEGHVSMIAAIHKDAGIQPPAGIQVDNYDSQHPETGTVGLYYD